MRVYLIRHGEAGMAHPDSARQLTPAGRAEAAAIARFLRRNHASAGAVWHSAKTRARETAEIVRLEAGFTGDLIEHRGLLPADHPGEVAGAIDAESDDLCVVGHLPHLAYLASALLVGPNANPFAIFETASALCVERDGNSHWHLRWMISPAQLQE